MKKEVIDYLIEHHNSFLTTLEKLAHKHSMSNEKVATIDEEKERTRRKAAYLKIGWLSNNDQVLALLKDGVSAFRERAATRIYIEYGGEALLNRCPKCQG